MEVFGRHGMPAEFVFFEGSEYVSTALAIGWDVTVGRLFPVVESDDGQETVPLTATRMSAAGSPAS